MKRCSWLVAMIALACSVSVFAQGPIRSGPKNDGRRESDRRGPGARPTPRRIILRSPSASANALPTSLTLTPPVRSTSLGTSPILPVPPGLPRPAVSDIVSTVTVGPRPRLTPRAATAPTSRALLVSEPRDPARVVVATVGAQQLTLKEVQSQAALLRTANLAGPKEEVARYRRAYARELSREIYNDWVDTKLLATEARARGLTVTRQEADQYLQGTTQMSNLKIPVAARIRLQGVDERKFQEALNDGILGDKLVRLVIHERITDDLLRDAYVRTPVLFWFMPKRHVRQLCYQFQGAETANSVKDMQKKMNSIRRRLTWFGGKLEDYATQKYALPNLFYVDLGWLTLGDPVSSEQQFVYNTVFQLEPPQQGKEPQYVLKLNEISPVLQSPAGFYLFQVVEELPSRRKTLDEARVDVENTFFNQVRENSIKELERKYPVTRDPEGLFRREPAGEEEPLLETSPAPLVRGNPSPATIIPPPVPSSGRPTDRGVSPPGRR